MKKQLVPRVLATTGVALAVAGLTAAAGLLPAPTPAASVTGLPVDRAVPVLTCPGPETLLVPDGGRAVDPGGAVLVRSLVATTAGPVEGRLELRGADSGPAARAAASPPSGVTATAGTKLDLTTETTSRQYAGTSNPQVGVKTLAAGALGPGVLQVSRAGTTARAEAGSASSAAVQSTLARSGDLRALTGTRCGAATAGTWLVGGATGGGERMRLLLANPAATPAVVDVDVRGPQGPVPAPAGDGVVVPPGAEIPLYIDALAPGLKRVAVHVTAREGRVRATLHDSLMRGLVPGGADDVPPAAAPAKHQVVPGVSLVDGFGRNAGDPDAAGSTSLRIAVPGTEEAVVRVRLLNGSGSVALPRTSVVNVPAGGVADVPVSGVAAGTYTAVVESDVPVVAGAKVGREPSGDSEFAWAAGASAISSGWSLLQPGTSSTLSLAAAGRAGHLRVTEVDAAGALSAPTTVSVPAGASAAVRFSSSATGFLIDGVEGGPVQGAVVATVDDPHGTMISVLPVDLPAPPATPSKVRDDPRLGLR